MFGTVEWQFSRLKLFYSLPRRFVFCLPAGLTGKSRLATKVDYFAPSAGQPWWRQAITLRKRTDTTREPRPTAQWGPWKAKSRIIQRSNSRDCRPGSPSWRRARCCLPSSSSASSLSRLASACMSRRTTSKSSRYSRRDVCLALAKATALNLPPNGLFWPAWRHKVSTRRRVHLFYFMALNDPFFRLITRARTSTVRVTTVPRTSAGTARHSVIARWTSHWSSRLRWADRMRNRWIMHVFGLYRCRCLCKTTKRSDGFAWQWMSIKIYFQHLGPLLALIVLVLIDCLENAQAVSSWFDQFLATTNQQH